MAFQFRPVDLSGSWTPLFIACIAGVIKSYASFCYSIHIGKPAYPGCAKLKKLKNWPNFFTLIGSG